MGWEVDYNGTITIDEAWLPQVVQDIRKIQNELPKIYVDTALVEAKDVPLDTDEEIKFFLCQVMGVDTGVPGGGYNIKNHKLTMELAGTTYGTEYEGMEKVAKILAKYGASGDVEFHGSDNSAWIWQLGNGKFISDELVETPSNELRNTKLALEDAVKIITDLREGAIAAAKRAGMVPSHLTGMKAAEEFLSREVIKKVLDA